MLTLSQTSLKSRRTFEKRTQSTMAGISVRISDLRLTNSFDSLAKGLAM